MYKLIFSTLFLSAALTGTSALSAEEARTKHYEAEAPTDSKTALKTITERVGEMETATGKGDINLVHKLSYDLEAAYAKLEKGTKSADQDKAIKAFRLAVDATHFASEDGTKEEVLPTLPKLKETADALIKSYN